MKALPGWTGLCCTGPPSRRIDDQLRPERRTALAGAAPPSSRLADWPSYPLTDLHRFDKLEHDPEKHALAKARVDSGFRKRLVPAQAGIMLHQ